MNADKLKRDERPLSRHSGFNVVLLLVMVLIAALL